MVEQDAITRIAEVNFESVMEARRRITDEVSSSSRWIMATLVSINLATAGMSLSATELLGGTTPAVLALSGAGVIFAVFLGYSLILAADGLMVQLTELANEWLKGMVGGELDAVGLGQKEAALPRKVRPWRIAAHVLGWLSLSCFIVSALAVFVELN